MSYFTYDQTPSDNHKMLYSLILFVLFFRILGFEWTRATTQNRKLLFLTAFGFLFVSFAFLSQQKHLSTKKENKLLSARNKISTPWDAAATTLRKLITKPQQNRHDTPTSSGFDGKGDAVTKPVRKGPLFPSKHSANDADSAVEKPAETATAFSFSFSDAVTLAQKFKEQVGVFYAGFTAESGSPQGDVNHRDFHKGDLLHEGTNVDTQMQTDLLMTDPPCICEARPLNASETYSDPGVEDFHRMCTEHTGEISPGSRNSPAKREKPVFSGNPTAGKGNLRTKQGKPSEPSTKSAEKPSDVVYTFHPLLIFMFCIYVVRDFFEQRERDENNYM